MLLLHRRQLDLLRVGDDEAASLGAPVARVRLIVVIAATLGTAAVVAVSGLIGFVGIIVPHLIRLVAGASYYRVLPLSVLLGAAFLILADIPGAGAHRSGRDADRRGHRVLRRAVLPRRAARPARESTMSDARAAWTSACATAAPSPLGVRSPTHGPSGEWLGLIGPNGAGKSSLLRAVVGLVAAPARSASTARCWRRARTAGGRSSSPTCRRSR